MSKWGFVWLILILILGGALRFWGLGSAELTFDEGFYAFRSIGYLDYLYTAAQPTPVDRLSGNTLPFWTYLSFHDHPPLVFLIMHVFFNIFGDTFFAARLPSVLAGLLSIILIFLILKNILGRVFNPNSALRWGLFGAFLFSVTFAPVAMARLAMLEAVSLFLILLNIYFFLKFLEDKKYWFYFGFTLGLAFLAKYTAFFLPPAYLVFLLFTKSARFRGWRLAAAFLITLILFSPVIIYNIYFYQNFGHFDLQFSYLLRQKTPEWQGVSGKTMDPFSSIGENALAIFSLPFLALALAGALLSFFGKKLNWREHKTVWFMFSILFFETALFVKIGSAIRFVSLYAVPAVFFIALFFSALFEKFKNKIWIYAPAALLLAYELFFTLNLLFVHPPDYGVVKLDRYFDSVFGDARSAGVPRHPNPRLEAVIEKYLPEHPATLAPSGIIYDDNLALSMVLWVFARRQFYHGIPIMTAKDFEEKLKAGKGGAFSGYELYFVASGPGAPLTPPPAVHNGAADKIEAMLKNHGASPDFSVKSSDGEPAFNVYKFSI